MNTTPRLIRTRRSRARYLLDSILTLACWAAFVWLFGVGLVKLLAGELTEQLPGQLPGQLSGQLPSPAAAPGSSIIAHLPAPLRDALGTLGGYTVLMGFFAIVLILWFQYNEYFGKYAKHGRYRRRGTPAATRQALKRSLGVTPEQFNTAQNARVMTVQYDDAGAVVEVQT